jgi:hypothetical protein
VRTASFRRVAPPQRRECFSANEPARQRRSDSKYYGREPSGQQAITPAMVRKFARTARERMRLQGGGYRRDHLRALAQRVESQTKRSASWDRKAICSGRWPPPRAQCRLRSAFAVLF